LESHPKTPGLYVDEVYSWRVAHFPVRIAHDDRRGALHAPWLLHIKRADAIRRPYVDEGRDDFDDAVWFCFLSACNRSAIHT
jgi:hypothetical protein